MYTLLQELKRTGPNNPALSLLVEPLLPRAWRKELDKQKLLKDDIDTDLYSRDIAQQDIQQAAVEEGPPTGHDFKLTAPGFVLTPEAASCQDVIYQGSQGGAQGTLDKYLTYIRCAPTTTPMHYVNITLNMLHAPV